MAQQLHRQRIILLFGDYNLITDYFRNHADTVSCSGLFLSKDASLFVRLKDLLTSSTDFISSGDELQEIAEKYRQVYIDYVGDLSSRNNSLSWYLTSVSEKNPFVSNVFLQFCYLKLVERSIGGGRDLVVICGSRSLMKAIRENFSRADDLLIELVDSRFLQIYDRGRFLISGTGKKSVFLFRFICRILVSRFYAVMKGHVSESKHGNRVAIHSWTDSRSFDRQSGFNDVYFGNLGMRIRKQNSGFFYLSNILPTIPYLTAVWKLKAFPEPIYLFEEFLNFGDIVHSLGYIRQKLPDHLEIPRMDSLDISPIIDDDLAADKHNSSRSEYTFLYYFAARRLAQRMNLVTFIYTFENHMWEKMLIAGIRASPSATHLVGYAHSIVSPMYLFYSLSASENRIAPVPDRIIVNGKRARERLQRSGFSGVPIDIGGSFRYEHLFQEELILQKENPGKKSILVVPSAGIQETIELIATTIEAFRSANDLAIRIKLHPALSYAKIKSFLPEMPGHFLVSEESVENLLEKSDLLLYTESAVAIEALARHKPILHIGSKFRIDMDVFDNSDAIRSMSDPDQIKRYCLDLLSGRERVDEKTFAMYRDFFEPVDENITGLFLGNTDRK